MDEFNNFNEEWYMDREELMELVEKYCNEEDEIEYSPEALLIPPKAKEVLPILVSSHTSELTNPALKALLPFSKKSSIVLHKFLLGQLVQYLFF